ncbi:hypothetical protein [Cohnella faecalis]|uniref:hypothetical protein n=1 Tax=Cohnella faecalis TaxID=2315694 RepID=UPI0011C235D5|nr:hypothetical protein [Cohnella faecalis]
MNSRVFPELLVQFVTDLLSDHSEELGGDEEFLHENPIHLCETNDPLLSWLAQSPFGPEYVERIVLPGLTLYRVGVLLDNDAFVQYLILAGTLDGETECWLAENASVGGDYR